MKNNAYPLLDRVNSPSDLKKLTDYADKVKKMNKNLGLDLQDTEREVFKSYRGRWKQFS